MKGEQQARNFKFGTLINYRWIGRHFADRIRQQPDIKMSVMQELVMKKYKCFVTHTQCKRARSWALTEFEKSLEEHYALLRPYGDALLRTNHGSTVKLGTTQNPDGKVYFDRFYVCLAALKLDNWIWFLSLLEEDLQCPEGDQLTLMSDQHKGLIEAVKEVMPRAEHRQCARHIYENFKKIYSGEHFRSFFWKACKATYPAQFEEAMKEVKVANPNAFKYLMDRNPKSWSRAFFWLHTGCEAVENGFSECWNSVLLKVRNKPIITLLESLRVIIMIRLEGIRELSAKWVNDVCPAIRKKMDLIKNERESRSCDCRLWELSGIPCVHAVNAIFKLNQEPEDYISGWFRLDMYREAYNQCLIPVGGMDTWQINPDHNVPLPPRPRNMPGRPKKQRIKAVHEPRVSHNRVTRHGAIMTCSKCWQQGHNMRGCKNGAVPRPAHIKKPRKKKTTKVGQDESATGGHTNQSSQRMQSQSSQRNNNESQGQGLQNQSCERNNHETTQSSQRNNNETQGQNNSQGLQSQP
uniref:uncharacterized protein LOC122608941 n=1 Tax=Erigeron canadensis TaxID=72917 RepID=UPI001CB9AFF8|nr:uncharacterized protein LOC122608941 [Erigeron canadensis]